MKRNCQLCGVEINGRGATKFCSRKCSAGSRKTTETKICEQCKESFAVGGGGTRGRAARARRFCSHKCAAIARNPRKIRVCIGCGKEFTRRGHNQPKYCSVQCLRSKVSELHKVTLTCDRCGITFDRWRSQRVGKHHYCSGACRSAGRVYTKGKDNPLFRGGARWTTDQGYVYFELDGVRRLEHRVVMEKVLGRKLERYETVHHINGDRADNRPENLQLRSGRHGKGITHRCLDCGSTNISSSGIKE